MNDEIGKPVRRKHPEWTLYTNGKFAMVDIQLSSGRLAVVVPFFHTRQEAELFQHQARGALAGYAVREFPHAGSRAAFLRAVLSGEPAYVADGISLIIARDGIRDRPVVLFSIEDCDGESPDGKCVAFEVSYVRTSARVRSPEDVTLPTAEPVAG